MNTLVGITGASGFIGSHVTEALVGAGYRVRCFVRPTSRRDFLGSLAVEFFVGDPGLVSDVAAFVEGCEVIVHLAGATSAVSREAFLQTNQGFTGSLLLAAIGSARTTSILKKFIFVSSQEATAPSSTSAPVTEVDFLPPFTDYGWSKREAEKLFSQGGDGGEEEGLGPLPFEYVILRPGPVYGPRDKDFLVLFRGISRGFELRFAFPTAANFLYVGNLTYFILRAIEVPLSAPILLINDGPSLTGSQFAESIRLAFGRKTFVIPVPRAMLWMICWFGELRMWMGSRHQILNLQKYRMLVHPNLTADSSLARAVLGPPPFGYPEGLGLTARWYREKGWL